MSRASGREAVRATERARNAGPELLAALQYALDVIRTDGDIRQVEQVVASAIAKAA